MFGYTSENTRTLVLKAKNLSSNIPFPDQSFSFSFFSFLPVLDQKYYQESIPHSDFNASCSPRIRHINLKKMLEARDKEALEDSSHSWAGCTTVAMGFILKTKCLNRPFSKYIISIEDKMLDLIQFSFILLPAEIAFGHLV